ncbi:MAG: hypothetical protein ACI8VE_001157 [Natrialbaceae archaeon]|jgi:hypothetical protein
MERLKRGGHECRRRPEGWENRGQARRIDAKFARQRTDSWAFRHYLETMETWTLLAAYAGVILTLQVLVYLYYRRRSSQGNTGRMTTPVANHEETPGRHRPSRGGSESEEEHETIPDQNPDTLTCPHCGAVNRADPTYTYCRDCVNELGA